MISVEKHDRLTLLRLNHGVTNAINPEMAGILERELDSLIPDICKERQGLILAGGDKFFSMGLDLPAFLMLDRPDFSRVWAGFNRILLKLYTLPAPTVCAMQGHTIAGGAVLALATDFRIGAKGKKQFGMNEVKLGLPIPYASDLILRQLVSDSLANQLTYGGTFMTMESLEHSGLMHSVESTDQVESAAIELLSSFAKNNGPAFAQIKSFRTQAIAQSYEANRIKTNEKFKEIWFSPETREKLQEAAKSFTRP